MKWFALSSLAMCGFLALPMLGATEEPAKDKAGPVEGKKVTPKDVLKSLEGSWEGTCQTWFEPGKLADESKVTGEIRSMFNGRVIRHTYDGTIKGKPRHGEETMAWSFMSKHFQVSWLDDFHTGYAIMFFEGDASERGFTVNGKYQMAPNTPQWGWRTVYDLVDADHLTITAYNIKPDGQESKAVETKYVRKKS